MAIATRSGAPQFPTFSESIAPTDHAALDAAIAALQARRDAWVAVSLAERITLMDRLIADFAALAPRWVAASVQAKGIAPNSPSVTDEWAAGVYATLKHLRQMRNSLSQIAASGRPRIPGPITTRTDGQVVARVFPYDRYDALFFGGLTANVWMEPGVTEASLPETQAVIYHDKNHPGKVALVLGAGNVSSIGPLDALYKLFVEDQVVVFKANPVNAYLGPLMEEAFRALIEPGYLRIVYGGAAEGAYLCNHPGIDEIHITGSDKTFDAIVFGTGAEGAERKAAGTPLLTKRISGELGNVSPVIVVPGPWSAGDLAYQGDHIASSLTNNAGFNCNATRVIIQHAGWGQRNDLMARIRDVLAQTPRRRAYYPGARDRFNAFLAEHPDAEQLGVSNDDDQALPWALIQQADAAQTDDIVFNTEAFCSLFAETELPANSVADYVDQAVAFCNEKLWGTLNATLIVHPASLRDPAVAAAVERAIAALRYGTIGVNYWAGAGFTLGVTTWGAFPGHPLNDIRSGVGVVHNTLMFARPQKSVLRAPFKVIPTPPWFVTQGKKGAKVFERLSMLEASPSPLKVPGILSAALFG